MFLTRVEIDTKKRAAMKLLSSLQVMHAVVEACFDDDSRKLWRLDRFQNALFILILSERKPNLTRMKEEYGYPNQSNEQDTKDYQKVLDMFQGGQIWRFRLRANPVHSVMGDKDSGTARGRVFPHVTAEHQKKWLEERSERLGFSLKEFEIVQREEKKFKKRNQMVSLTTATFEGILKIENAEVFRSTVVSGIGRAKAYGCGLLTIARV